MGSNGRGRGREPERSIPPSRPATVSVPALPTLSMGPQHSLCVDRWIREETLGHAWVTLAEKTRERPITDLHAALDTDRVAKYSIGRQARLEDDDRRL